MRKALLVVALLLAPAPARAQPTPPLPAPAPVAPLTPHVEDPMLAPVPPAARNIATWQEALDLLRARSTDLRTAYDEVLRAEANSRVALAGALFTVTGTGTATHNFITNTTPATPDTTISWVDSNGKQVTPIVNNVPSLGGLLTIPGFPASGPFPSGDLAIGTGSITAVQPLLNLQTWHAIGTAHRSEEASRLSLDDIKRNLAFGVANAIVGVVTAERIAELNRIGLRQALERLDITKRKQALGAANGLDVVRVQQDVESARATLVTGDESLRQAREALGLALGIPEQVGVTREVNLDGLERDALSVCQVAPSIDHRADVAAQHRRLEAASSAVADAEYAFAPTANAQSTVATTTAATGGLPSTTWNIQGVLSIPFWDGGVRIGNRRSALALQDEAAQSLEALRRQATVQVEQARRGVSVAEGSTRVAAEARRLAAEQDRLVRLGYEAGQGTSLELVVAASALRQAEINLALQQFGVIRARVLAVLSLATCPW